MRKAHTYFLPAYLLGGTALFGFLSLSIDDKVEEPYFDKQVSEYVSSPVVNVQGQNFSLETLDQNAKIYYTVSGKLPTEGDARYYQSAGDLSLEKNSGNLLRIRTSHRYKSPITMDLPFKAKVVRFTQQLKYLGYSKPQMTTVFSKHEKHKLKILSLAVDGDQLFDPIDGKMVIGAKFWNRERRGISEPWWAQEANYREKGFKSSIYAGAEFIDEDGRSIAQDNFRLRIHGNASRAFAQKSFRLEGESYYGSGAIKDVCDLVPGDSLSSLMLRNSGNDWGRSMFQDAYIQSIAQQIGLPALGSEPVHVMINGTYWGIYNLRPRFDERNLSNYSEKDGRFALIELDSELDEGKQKDLDDYMGLKNLIGSKSVDKRQKQEELESKVDLDNFIDYIIVETFFSNGDWNPNNVKTFRFGKKDKWKWAIHDMDYGMTYTGLEAGLNSDLFVKLKKGNTVTSSVFMFLISIEEYRERFHNRAQQLLERELSSQNLNDHLEAFKETYEHDIDYQISRWKQPASKQYWYSVIDGFESFNKKRQEIYLNQLKSL